MFILPHAHAAAMKTYKYRSNSVEGGDRLAFRSLWCWPD